MLSSQLIKTMKPWVVKLTPAQKLELIRWIVENPPETDSQTSAVHARSPEVESWEARISGEAAAWYARPEADRAPYAGQYVAVLQGKVVDHDTDRAALAQRIQARYPETPVLLTTAEARAPREFHMRSPCQMPPSVEVVGDTQGETPVLGRNFLNKLIMLLDGPDTTLYILAQRPRGLKF